MAQFDLHANANPGTAASVPYLLDVQSDLLASLLSRVVIPLREVDAGSQPIEKLNPVVEHGGRRLLLSTAEMAGVPLAALGDRVGSLAGERDRVVAAIDFLVCGI
jgi:toxin CcdB